MNLGPQRIYLLNPSLPGKWRTHFEAAGHIIQPSFALLWHIQSSNAAFKGCSLCIGTQLYTIFQVFQGIWWLCVKERLKFMLLFKYINKYIRGHHSLLLFSSLVNAYLLKHTKSRWILVNIYLQWDLLHIMENCIHFLNISTKSY